MCDIVPIELAGRLATMPDGDGDDDSDDMEFSRAFSGSNAARDDFGLCGCPLVLIELLAWAEVADSVLLGCQKGEGRRGPP